VEVADVSGDGLTDVIVVHGGGTISLYLQQNDGTLGGYSLYELPYSTFHESQGLAIGDINEDTLPDILVAGHNSGLDVLYHVSPGTDTTSPTVTSIVRADTNPASTSSVDFTVTFSEPVIGVDADDFTVTATGISGPLVSNVSGSGHTNTYIVTVNTGTGNGTLRLDVPVNATITDPAGNPLNGLPFAGSETYTIDKTVLFEPYVTYSDESPLAVGVGDFNHDGLNDVAVTSYIGAYSNDDELKIFLQNGWGSLDSAVAYTAGTRAEALAVGDLNNDGWDDVAVTNSISNTISVFLQQADGTMGARTTYATGTGPDAVAVGDVNGDGLDDVAVANGGSAFISIFIQNEGGTLNAKVDYTSPDAGNDDIAIGDVNGDGLNDVVKMNGHLASPNLSVFTQTGTGTLNSAVSYSVPGDILGTVGDGDGIGIGDVTGDGKSDVVMSYWGTTALSSIAVFAQGGDGTLQSPVSYTAYNSQDAVEVADVNEDGLADVIVVHGGWDAISVYLQQNDGTLGGYSLYGLPYASDYKPQGLAIGDISGDTLPDILVADYNHGLNVLYHVHPDAIPSTMTSIVRADANPTSASSVDFTVTFSEPVSGVDADDFTLTATGVSDPLVSNVNGSGRTYIVTVNTGTGNGTLRLDVPVSAAITDQAGNPLSGLPFTSGETYIIDKTVLLYPYATYSVESAYAIGVGDFNHDGLDDAAVANTDSSFNSELKIFFQNGWGSLDSAVTYAAGTEAEALAVGDLNNDGWDDVVVTNSGKTISVFLQQVDGTLAARTTYATGTGPNAVAVGDVNGDGLDDVAVANGNSTFISIFIQNSSGTLNAKVDYPSPDAGFDDIAIGDVNGDGLNDVVKMNGSGLNPDLSVYIQTTGGTLSSAVSYSVAGSYNGNGIGVGDVTGDGKSDVVMSYGGNTPYAFIAVFAQGGDGTLQSPVSYASYDIPEPVEVADVNEDGLADVIVAHGWDAISVYLQQNDGTLGGYSLYELPDNSASHYKPQGLSVGDINDDAQPDILAASHNSGLDVLYHVHPDAIPPTMTSIVRADANHTSASSVDFTVTFSEPVIGVDADDFTVTATGISDPLVSNVSGSGRTYIVTVNTGTGNGTLRLDVPISAAITDPAGNPLNGLPFAGGETYTIDKTVLFEPYDTYSVESPYAVGAGDFNHDGLNDVAVTRYISDGSIDLKIFLQNGSGGLDSAVTYAAGGWAWSLAVGDLNNDGWDDVVVTNFTSSTISVFLQQADGTLAARTTYTTGIGPDAVAVGDVNGDGLDDVAVANGGSAFISIFIQNEGGTLNAKVDYTSPKAGNDDIAIGDVNGDGLNDVVKMNGKVYTNPDLSVFTQTGTGTLNSAISYSLPGSNITGNGIGIGDATGDGKLDVVMSYGGNRPAASIAIFAQGGDGTLQSPVSYAAYDIPDAPEVADVNEDSLADVIVVHGGWNAVSIYLQQDGGTLGGYSLHGLPDNSANNYPPQGLAFSDINKDAAPDILVANYKYGLNVLYHVPPPTIRILSATSDGTGDCSTWANACRLQTALTSAVSGDEIWVAAGTHKPTTGTDRSATFQLKSGVAVYGGFAGTETERSQRNPATNVTILSGDIDNNDSQTPIVTNMATVTGNTTNSYHVVTGATGTILDGFTITAGNANDTTSPKYYGGGMYNNASSPTLTNVIFSGNSSENGGGIYNKSSNPTMTNVTFSSNTADVKGGGMCNDASSPTLTNVTFSGNSAISGGGMDNNSSSPTLTNVTFSGNSADFIGGSMYNYSSSPILKNVTFSGNSADSGGGIGNSSASSPTLTNVTFSGNSATSGGGMDNNSSSPSLTNVTFSGNSADFIGGGMGNSSASSPILVNVTFSDNSASTNGGGMYNNSSSPQIRDTIFWGNTATSGSQIYNNRSAPSVSDSVVQGGYEGGTNILTADPLLGTLGDYGGFTQTTPLLPGSSAIDAGDDDTCAATDQRGISRTQGAGCDIGAYELIQFAISGNAGVAGATLSYTDGIGKIATAGASGAYSFTVSYGWSGTVTPSKAGYTFTPASKDYTNVTANKTGENYTATLNTYTISGNAGVAGAAITYTGGSTTADDAGAYSFTVSHGWSGTVTPSKAGYTFTPASKSYTNVKANKTGENYTTTLITYTISGNAGVADATITYSGGSTTTDDTGAYFFTISYGWTGTVTPSKDGYTFTPASREYTLAVTADQTAQDCTAALNTTTAITADTPDPSVTGQVVAVTVTVAGASRTPTGTVNITGADTNCSINLVDGTGSCNVVFNSAGAKTIIATYSGDEYYGGSTTAEAHQVNTAERAKNGGFNTYSGTSKIPKYWTMSNFSSTDGKYTSIKKEGSASVRISGAAGKTKTLTQTLSLSGAKGQPLTFSYWVKASAMPTAGSCYGQVLFYYGTSLKGTKTLRCPTGATYTWKQVKLNLTAPATYNKVLIRFTYNKASGRAWFDLASLLR
jgi:hypothetical protein